MYYPIDVDAVLIERVQAYLEEKLSPNQIHYDFSFHPPSIADFKHSKSPYIRLKNVPTKFFEQVVWPGLREIVSALGYKLVTQIYIPNEYFEFYIVGKEKDDESLI